MLIMKLSDSAENIQRTLKRKAGEEDYEWQLELRHKLSQIWPSSQTQCLQSTVLVDFLCANTPDRYKLRV